MLFSSIYSWTTENFSNALVVLHFLVYTMICMVILLWFHSTVIYRSTCLQIRNSKKIDVIIFFSNWNRPIFFLKLISFLIYKEALYFYNNEKITTWKKYQTELSCKSVVNNFPKNNIGYIFLGYSQKLKWTLN